MTTAMYQIKYQMLNSTKMEVMHFIDGTVYLEALRWMLDHPEVAVISRDEGYAIFDSLDEVKRAIGPYKSVAA